MKVLQLHKRSSYQFKFIQDKWAVNSESRCLALADGTTQSFNSEAWAEIVSNGFVANPSFDAKSLVPFFQSQADVFKNQDHQFSPNPAKASLERSKQGKGGTSTFVGLQFKESNTLEVISCGDSNLFLLKSKGETIYFPYSDVNSLDNNNKFLNTEQLMRNEVDDSFFEYNTLSYAPEDTLILATDALSRLLLKRPELIAELLAIENFNELHDFCLKHWEGNALEEDDISAIIIEQGDIAAIKKIQPSEDFSFPKEKEYEFVPNPGKDENELPMNEILNQFKGVAQDFHMVKKKQSRQSMLTLSLLILILFNIGLTVYLVFEIQKGKNEKTNQVIDRNFPEWISDMFNLSTRETNSNEADKVQE